MGRFDYMGEEEGIDDDEPSEEDIKEIEQMARDN